MSSIDQIRKTFAEQRYVKIERLMEDGLRQMLYDHVQRRLPVLKGSEWPGFEGAPEMFSDQLMEFVLAGVKPRIEELSGLTLDPTYSFLRVYRRGHRLPRHLDRASCEVSVSVNLGPKLEQPWPIWLKGPLSESAVDLAPGDAVLYRGIECEHWRDPLEANEQTQVFLHYVERDGKYSAHKYDKRDAIGILKNDSK